jgi:hypothetical protein
MSKVLDLMDGLNNRRTFGFFDDFEWFISPHRWTGVTDSTGAAAIDADEPHGAITLTTAATANDATAVHTTNEVFLFAADKPLVYETRLKFTEGNTDDIALAVGFSDAMGVGLIADGGASIASGTSGLIYKRKDTLVWRVASSRAAVPSLGTRGTTGQDDATSLSSTTTSYKIFRIEVLNVLSTTGTGTGIEITYFVDGVQLQDTNNIPIKHVLNNTFSNGTHDMECGAVLLSAGTAEVVTIDYIAAYQLRGL